MGLPPFGYVPDRGNRTYVISDPEAERVRAIFAFYSQGGVSQYRIAKELNDAGMLRPDGEQWDQAGETHPGQSRLRGAVCLR